MAVMTEKLNRFDEKIVKLLVCKLKRIEQFNGREGETATFIRRCLFTLNLCGGGFAPRHLKR